MSSPRALDPAERNRLMKEAATLARGGDAVFDVIDEAVVSAIGVIDDPVLAARVRRGNRLNIEQWLTRTILDPGRMPDYLPTQEILHNARENARVGLGEVALEAFRAGQAAAWAGWTRIVFGLTDDVEALRAVLEFSHASISRYVAQGAGVIRAENARGLADLAEGGPEKRRRLTQQILDGLPFDATQASRQLDYALRQSHQALILWGADPTTDPTELDRVVTRISDLCVDASPLCIVDDRIRRWLWCPTERPLPTTQIASSCPAQVRIAVGPVAAGIEGFRRSHDGARVAQTALAAAPHATCVANYEEVRLAALMTKDRERARTFVSEALGDLAQAQAHLREALRQHLKSGENVTKTAKALKVHRNTVMRQLGQAEALLPRPLDDARVEVAAALEVQRWLPAE